jgi:pimeloyl-ACP methyl ester carboxylesterase
VRLNRGGQQWIFDKMINDTGRVFHYQEPGRGRLPSSVKMHAMVSQHLGQGARRLEKIADTELAAGNTVTALEFYFDAAAAYGHAQHTVFSVNEEKEFLHGSSLRCYERVRELAPYPIERIEVEVGDSMVAGYFHRATIDGPAPTIFFIPGCDMTKEMVPHPLYNFAAARGMHLFSFDGPGQGESNLRKLYLTEDNYEQAASAALTALLARDDVSNVALYSLSFGSYWGARFAATDHRLSAAALAWASICDKYYLFEEESPRYKQLFAFMTGAKDEKQLDAFREKMDLTDLMPKISAPTLLTVGQYDPRSPIEEVYQHYDRMTSDRELWVFENQHHQVNLKSQFALQWQGDHHSLIADWLKLRMSGVGVSDSGKTKWIAPSSAGPNAATVLERRRWFDER